MRLLVVSSWMPCPPDNGSRLRAYHLLRYLSRRHAITLLTFNGPHPLEETRPALEQLCERVEVVPAHGPGSARLGLKGLLTSVPRHYVQTRSQRMADLVNVSIDNHNAVLALQPAAALYVAEARRTTPSVFDELEVGVFRDRYLSEKRPIPRLRHALTWTKFRRFARSLTDSFDRTTVVSALEREYLGAIGCDVARVAIIPNGVEWTGTTPSPTERLERLIYPGSVTYSANLDAVRYFVTQILPVIRRTRPGLEFVVTGSTDGVDVADLAAADGVRFTGWVPDVAPMIAESTACVVPLRIGGGTRLKILQAMALGTPVVSTSKGVEGLDLEPGRHLLVADSPHAFADRIIQLAGDPWLGRSLASEAQNAVRDRYAWEPIAQSLESVIETAVDERRSTLPRERMAHS